MTFLALSFILKFLNVINVSFAELTGYALIFYGINLVYISFSKSRRVVLFSGTLLFLIGLILFLVNNFEFSDANEIIFPSILFIFGICFLMLFLDDTSKKNSLIISLTFMFTGSLVTTIVGEITISSFFNTVIIIVSSYWPVALIVIGIILLIHRDEKERRAP